MFVDVWSWVAMPANRWAKRLGDWLSCLVADYVIIGVVADGWFC
jgi:hypothetical protein